MKAWFFGLMTVSLTVSVLYSLLPKGKFQTIFRFAGGITLLLVLVRPLCEADWLPVEHSLQEWRDRINAEESALSTAQNEELAALIADKTAAYIQDRAASLGVDCYVQVVCQVYDGIPFPVEVVMDVPYHEVLSDVICKDLAIPKEAQQWQTFP